MKYLERQRKDSIHHCVFFFTMTHPLNNIGMNHEYNNSMSQHILTAEGMGFCLSSFAITSLHSVLVRTPWECT